ncbi:unnamed protein product [Protopolystoma xenopodis]|uniref:EH domain-containing protein n=1 Tax=Protopolystoma xenopodis TaxID=117903 RepID=A0A3S5CR81_9PLAT|nr:unnamed protein product [Protopolystoma xenopodis]
MTLNPLNGKVSGASAREHMVKSRLPNNVLRKIWMLGDVDQDGYLDEDEFALVCYLMRVKLEGDELPTVLPEHLIPPSKRVGRVDSNTIATPGGGVQQAYAGVSISEMSVQ